MDGTGDPSFLQDGSLFHIPVRKTGWEGVPLFLLEITGGKEKEVVPLAWQEKEQEQGAVLNKFLTPHYLIRRKTLPTKYLELTEPDLY